MRPRAYTPNQVREDVEVPCPEEGTCVSMQELILEYSERLYL
jgi:hypothetical protein